MFLHIFKAAGVYLVYMSIIVGIVDTADTSKLALEGSSFSVPKGFCNFYIAKTIHKMVSSLIIIAKVIKATNN